MKILLNIIAWRMLPTCNLIISPFILIHLYNYIYSNYIAKLMQNIKLQCGHSIDNLSAAI